MKHAFERLDKLIKEGPCQPGLTEKVKTELAMVNSYLIRCSVEYTKEKALELLIQQCQGHLVALLDSVFNDGEARNAGCASGLTKERGAIMQLLEGMLGQIEKRYTKYFNQEANVPEIYLRLIQREAGEQCKQLQKAARFKQIDIYLLKLVMDPVHLFSRNKWGTAITYSRMMYIKELLNELKEAAQIKHEDYTNFQLILQLVYLNFNTPEMLRCITNLLLDEINLLKDALVREERMLQWGKELSQCPVKPGMALLKDHITLKVQLGRWIEDELQYFEKKQQRLFLEARTTAAVRPPKSKILMNLPVQGLGILVRAATEEGLLMNESVEGAIGKASQIFDTPGTYKNKGPSSASMRIKSYNPSKKDKEQVMDPLYGMIRRISKY